MTGKSVEQLVEEALDAYDDTAASVASHVRRAIRIATKRQDYPALIRLLPETFDLTVGTKVDHPALEDARINLAALLGREEARRQEIGIILRQHRDRTVGKDALRGESIGQLEAQVRQINEVIDSCRSIPDNLTPLDTYFVRKENNKAVAQLLPLRNDLEKVIERVRQSVHDILVETEGQLESGQRRPSVFERGRKYLEQALLGRAPEALEKFQAAEEALASGGHEDLAHAVTSCRRMIKALADALYPATGEFIMGEDGRQREMSDAAYRNRLLQFAVEQVGGATHRKLVQEALRSLGSRLERLNELSSKGVHDEISKTEAETCVMWTYLTAADFLRIADGTSPRLEGVTGVSTEESLASVSDARP
jgi:hypothetical protein